MEGLGETNTQKQLRAINDLNALIGRTNDKVFKAAIQYIVSNVSQKTTKKALSDSLSQVEHLIKKAPAGDIIAFSLGISALSETLPEDIIQLAPAYMPMHDATSANSDSHESSPLLAKSYNKTKSKHY